MDHHHLWQRRPRRIFRAAAVLAALIGLVALSSAGTAAAAVRPRACPKVTVVLVHGAWADSSSWSGVVGRLQDRGYTVDVFPTPLRSLAGDTAALRTYLAAMTGSIVLVGHSYGGAVVTDAATGDSKVKALVYIDAFAPDLGESVMSLPGATSALANPDPTKVFTLVPSTLPPTATTDLYVLPAVFRTSFANDLPARQAAILAATQRPVTIGALSEPSTAPAWRTIPSWYEVGTVDRVIIPEQQRMMAYRAHAHVVQIRASHLPMISHPAAVSQIIQQAADATS